jgi:hypothetical protein
MMQRYMPLIFGLIYLNVAALLNVYFIISSSIRIATQEILFRKGIVPGPPQAGAGGKTVPAKGPSGAKADRIEREIPRAKPPASTKGKAAGSGGAAAKPTSKSTTARARDVAGTGTKAGSNGSKSGTNGSKAGTNGSKAGTNGSGGTKSTGDTPRSGGGSKGRSRTENGASAELTDAVEDEPGSAPKEHPRSKAKRERKAR